MDDTRAAMLELKRYKKFLTRQEMRTIRGQILSGDVTAAMKGMDKILRRLGV